VATKKIYANTDAFMSALMEQLGIYNVDMDYDLIVDMKESEQKEQEVN